MKYDSPFDAYEETGSSDDFYKQFKTVIPEVGKLYKVVNCGIITEYVEILSIIDKVAIGKTVKDSNGGSQVGNIHMYNATGSAVGWKYKESRSGYRLQSINL